MSTLNHRILPGFRLSLSYALTYLTILVLIPLAACFAKASTLTWDTFWDTVWTERAFAAYELTFGASCAAAVVDVALGLLIAWVLVRYEFPLKPLFDAIAIELGYTPAELHEAFLAEFTEPFTEIANAVLDERGMK